MKRSPKALLVAGLTAAALAGPVAAPAQAANCVGIEHDTNGSTNYGVWECDPCPSKAGLGDGRVWVVICFSI